MAQTMGFYGEMEPPANLSGELSRKTPRTTPYIQTLMQEIIDITRDIERKRGDDASWNNLSGISRRIWADIDCHPPDIVRTTVIPMMAYKLILRSIREQLDCDVRNVQAENELQDQVNLFLEAFANSIAQARGISTIGWFQGASHFRITGGNFIHQTHDPVVEAQYGKIRHDMARLQVTSETTLQAVRLTIVLFY
ncbi:hypothetical protein GALMADRAFT_257274 [Galerina marginata CBS 339.88]|uniref:Uncharacterized protein n=1 Tax=Galerina marginata (strain CBS 339.88) TaxID=685588 RepID=A0A067SKN3_GALM3|nr:hypothetical protein GALMADRAFT_257274 [Galerina marginata CBS 339.88]